MRNSPFQLNNTSVINTLETNLAYKHHRQKIDQYKTTKASPRDHMIEMSGKNYHLQRTRRFENSAKYSEEEKSNLRLLNRFVEIQKGQHLSVPRAEYKMHLTKNPVQKNHSLNMDKKKVTFD